MQGGPVYAAEMGAAAAATEGLAAAQEVATATTIGLEAALAPLGGVLGGVIAAIGALVLVAGKATSAFAEAEDQVFQGAIAFQRLGSSLPFEEVQAFAGELSKAVAVDDDDIVKLAGSLLRFGVAGNQLKSTLATIADFAQATGQSLEEAGRSFELGLTGQERGLRRFGVEFKATGNRIEDTIRLSRELDRVFGGAGAARRNTLPGAIDALKVSFGNFMEAIGRVLAPAAIVVLNQLTAVINFLTDKIVAFAEFAERVGLPGFQGASQAAAGLKGSGDPALGYMKEIATNTGKTASGMDSFLRLGFGTGTVGVRAGNVRALRAALRGAI